MKIAKTNRAVKNIVFGSINKIVTIFFPFIIRTIIIRYLGTEYVGLNSLFSAILNVLNFAELGIGSAIVFSMYKPIAHDDKQTINALLNLYKKVYKICGIIVLVCGLAVMPFLPNLINGDYPADINLYILYSIYLLNTVIGYFFFAYKASLLSAHQRNDVSSNINTIVMTVIYLCQIIVLALFKNYYVYIIFLPLSTLVSNIYIAIVTKKMFPEYKEQGEIDKESKKIIKKQVAGLVNSKVCNIVQGSIDSICISAFWGLATLGMYNNYFYIISSIQGFFTVFYNSLLAGIGNAIETESVEFNQNLFNKIYFVYAWITGFCATCFICLFQPFIRVWVGANNLLPFTVMLCLVIQFYVGQMNSVVILYKEAKGLWWEDKFRPLFVSLFNLVGTIIAGKFMFLEGVVIATFMSQVLISTPFSTHILYKSYFKKGEIKYYLKHFVYLIVCAGSTALTYYICSLISLPDIWQCIVNLLICLVVPNLIYLALSFKTTEFKGVVEMGKKYINNLRHKNKLKQ